MTHRRTHTVDCDGGKRPSAELCQEQHAWHGTITIRDAEAYVRNKGWHVRPDGRHICPSCWKRGER